MNKLIDFENMASSKSLFIILPTYNRSTEIKKVLYNFTKQRYKNWILFVINDGSTNEHTQEYRNIFNNNKDERIIYQENEKNMNLPNTLNVGVKFFLESKKYDYMAWISDDNIYYPNFVYSLVKTLNEGHDFVNTRFDYIRTFRPNEKQRFTFYIYKDYQDMLKIFRGFGAIAWSYDCVKKVGYFNPELFLVEDFDYYLRTLILTDMKKVGTCKDSTMKIILSKSNLTALYKNKIKEIKNIIDMIYKTIDYKRKYLLENMISKNNSNDVEIEFVDKNNICEIKNNKFYYSKNNKKYLLSILSHLNLISE
jgi:glycosyltransferase involved in cell wall biosynthesis